MENKNKVIFLDWSMFYHRAYYAGKNNQNTTPEYLCLNMIVASLRRIGIDSNDTIIVACDGRGNWRKEIDKSYKGNRQPLPSEIYTRFDILLDKVDKGLDWYVIKIDNLEADDIME